MTPVRLPAGITKDIYKVTSQTFAALGLSTPVLNALEAAQYRTPTPIQAGTIPALLSGRDVLGQAQTGTGKTAAFVLPILERLSKQPPPNGKWRGPRAPRALILAPTRELAIQIADSVATYGRNLKLAHTVVMGGVKQQAQVRALSHGVDILIATPGRLLDLVEQRRADLRFIDMVVLDEADRMLDMGFIRDIRRLMGKLPTDRQSLLFSATMPQEIADLAGTFLTDPVRVTIAAKSVAVDAIDQRVHFAPQADKGRLLTQMLADPDMRRVVVFTRTKRGAEKVGKILGRAGVSSDTLHGNKSQNARQRALDGFRRGTTRVLVATDIAARGIDVDDVSHVINFELPVEPESYVHRIGRTARAGAQGIAVSLCDPAERKTLHAIERLIKRKLAVVGGTDAAPAEESGPSKTAPRPPRRRTRRRNRPKTVKTAASGSAPKPRRRRRRSGPRASASRAA